MVSAWWLLLAGAVGVSIGMFLFALMTISARPDEAHEGPPGNQLLT